MDKKTLRLIILFSAIIIVGVTICFLYNFGGVVTTPECGDGYCAVGETIENCPQDCAVSSESICNNDGVCIEPENEYNCPEDCASQGGPTDKCGDGICQD